MVLIENEAQPFGKGYLGTNFCSWVVYFFFIIRECKSNDEVESSCNEWIYEGDQGEA